MTLNRYNINHLALSDLPSDKYITLTYERSQRYTAPADGWVQFEIEIATGYNTYAHLVDETTGISAQTPSVIASNESWISLIIPVSKGDIFVGFYTTSVEAVNITFKFYYARSVS